jgi:nucleoside-diphosphate-sugar epimerase
VNHPIVILAGATGALGRRIANSLLESGATVRAIVRSATVPDKIDHLRARGAEIVEVDFRRSADLAQACSGGDCVVSALSGLSDVIVDTQTRLVEAAIKAGVPRFIPSDFAIDFTKLTPGANRNLDLRREFLEHLEGMPVTATSILCGMFTELLSGQAPLILFPLKRVVYWEDADQPLDFTTVDNAAAFTAAAALDPSTPRFLRIAGDQQSARGLKEVASEVTGEEFRLLRAGGLRRLRNLTRVTRSIMGTLRLDRREVYPPWQGMQYLHDMFSGRGKLEPLDNDRYPNLPWTTVRDVLAAR